MFHGTLMPFAERRKIIMKKYNICKNGIFKSIQGEGYNCGKSAVFVRLAGCNMVPRCPFCDETFDDFEEMDISIIINKILDFEPFEMVVITGGEPTIQDLSVLVCELKKRNLYVAIETNGLNKINYDLDWISCSPKTNAVGIERANELKFVVDRDSSSMNRFIEEISEKILFDHMFLQPKSNDKEMINNCIDMINANKKYRLSLQIHKMVGIK